MLVGMSVEVTAKLGLRSGNSFRIAERIQAIGSETAPSGY